MQFQSHGVLKYFLRFIVYTRFILAANLIEITEVCAGDVLRKSVRNDMISQNRTDLCFSSVEIESLVDGIIIIYLF